MADERNSQALAAIEAALGGFPREEFKVRLRRDLERAVMERKTHMPAPSPVVSTAGGTRPGFTAVTPYVRVPDVERLIEFAKQVFGAEETQRSTSNDGRIHCEMRIGDSMVMFGGRGGKNTGDTPVEPRLAAFHVHIPDVDAVHARAIEAGAESLMEPGDKPYGERASAAKDPTGNYWYIATYLGRGPEYLEAPLGTVAPHCYVQHLPAKGAAEFIDFMKAAFGARQEFRQDSPQGLIAHAVVRINGAPIEIGEGENDSPLGPTGFYLSVDDCDALYRQAVAAGAKSLFAPSDMPYGDRVGGVEDPWGNEWFISTHIGRESR